MNLDHLKRLKKAALLEPYATHPHNEMELMVAAGNPKGIRELARADIRTSMSNPVNEGSMRSYGKKVLQRHGLREHICGGRACCSCQTTPNNRFTAGHHRETPERILAGKADAGIVWVTATTEAKRDGAKVDSVNVPPQDSLRDEVSYWIGALTKQPAQGGRAALPVVSRHPGSAGRAWAAPVCQALSP